ncbi:MAG: hypothetical protein IH942_01450 [Acidobacteria bacterium]|nr:hypothetical protein [Acidobacteriota bacterium]
MKPDAALELVEAYLAVNDYFVLTEFELHEWRRDRYRTLTDVDVVAVRLPSPRGAVHYHDGDGTVECLLAGEVDPALGVATDRCDVIIGEVKRGEASFNPALRDPRVLHAVLRRVGVVTETPPDEVVDELSLVGWAATPWAQLRLVAFGSRGSVSDGTVIRHDHMMDWLNGVLERHRELFEVSSFSDPVLSLLAFAARIDRPLAALPDDLPAVPADAQ